MADLVARGDLPIREDDVTLLAPDVHRKNCILANITYNIIVIDEVHHMRNQNTALHQAILQLHAQFVLGVSGTRLNNMYADIGALAKIIRLKPLDNWNILSVRLKAWEESAGLILMGDLKFLAPF